MFKKNKIVVILIVISLYVTGVFLSYSGDLLAEIQKTRYENQIKKIKLCQTIIFSAKQWQAFSNKKEIKIKNTYYDVISFQKIQQGVVVKMVKDDLENEFRLVVSQILNKHKIPFSEKKDTSLFKHLLQKQKSSNDVKFDFEIDEIENYNTNFNLKTKSFIDLLFDPPC